MKIPARKILFVLLAVMIFFTSTSLADIEKISDKPWDHSPISVYIDDKDTPEQYSPTYREQVEIALDYWEKGGNGALSYQPEFKIIDNPDADINVRWVENLEKVEGAGEGVAGYCRPTIVGNKYLHAEIVLEAGNYQGFSWVQYGDANMQEVSKHEIGHALGLGHSTERGDIMYPSYEQRDNINPLLLESTFPYLIGAIIVIVTIIGYHGIGWRKMRKQRKQIEKEVFKGKE